MIDLIKKIAKNKVLNVLWSVIFFYILKDVINFEFAVFIGMTIIIYNQINEQSKIDI